MMRRCLPLLLLLALGACNSDMSGQSAKQDNSDAVQASPNSDPMGSKHPRPGEQLRSEIPDSQERPVMQLQVVLDRLGFTPGVVDGKMGLSTRNAISGFQEANDLETTGELNPETRQALARWSTIPATRIVTIPAEFADETFEAIPEDPARQARMQRLGYVSLDEKLAERFHTTVETLRFLNPGGRPAGIASANEGSASSAPGRATSGSEPAPQPSASPDSASGSTDAPGGAASSRSVFAAGQKIRVPNVGADRIVADSVRDAGWLATLRTLGVGSEQPKAERVIVSKSAGTLKVYDDRGELVGMYTATMGSRRDPLPLGNWKVLAVAHNPPFSYNPELFWDVPDSEAKQTLPPGPNGPVGVVWIDLSKEHYGIHGTPNPETIGRTQSHGCVRLTNWDAARLAQMVTPGTKVLFEA